MSEIPLPEEVIQSAYSDGGMMSTWAENTKNETWTSTAYRELKEYEILPSEISDSFVFLGVASNKGDKEIGIAKLWDKDLKPLESDSKDITFVITDFFGTNIENQFIPGFDAHNIPLLNHIKLEYVSAKAEQLPFGNDTVDVIFDMRGGVWHTIYKNSWEEIQQLQSGDTTLELDDATKDKIKADLSKLLENYNGVLKQGGKVILDDSANDTKVSTGVLLDKVLNDQFEEFLNERGFDFINLGDETSVELLVLVKTEK